MGLWGMDYDSAPGWAIDVADKQEHADECATFVLAVNRAPIFRNGLSETDRRMADQLVRDGVIARRAANWRGDQEYVGIALCPVDGDVLISGNCPTCARRSAKVHEVTPAQAAELREEFERAIGALPPAEPTREEVEAYRLENAALYGAIAEQRQRSAMAIGMVERAHDARVHVDRDNLAACLGGDTLTAQASERLILSRFLDYLERSGMVIGEYGKSEGGGSPLTPVESATEVLEDYLRPIRRSVAR